MLEVNDMDTLAAWLFRFVTSQNIFFECNEVNLGRGDNRVADCINKWTLCRSSKILFTKSVPDVAGKLYASDVARLGFL